jgi:hypothetical protein
MTIQKGKELLQKLNPTNNELKTSITALKQEKKYVENCIELGFREQSSGQVVVDEISEIQRFPLL